MQDLTVGTWLVLGEVMGVHIDESLLVSGVYDTGGPSAFFESITRLFISIVQGHNPPP